MTLLLISLGTTPRANTPNTVFGSFGLSDNDLYGSFGKGKIPDELPAHGLVHFSDKAGKWEQWLMLPAEGSFGSSNLISTDFLGPVQKASTVRCWIETDISIDPFAAGRQPCPVDGTHVDSGPIVLLREMYFDGSTLQLILTMIEDKSFAVGISEINDRIEISVDGKDLRTIPIHDYEPRTVAATLLLLPGRHVVRFGSSDTSNGKICL